MTTPIQSDDFHIGRDPNNTTWVVVRYPEDWAKAIDDRVYFDPLASVLELATAPSTAKLGPLCGLPFWLPLNPIIDSAGNRYLAAATADLILLRAPGAGAFVQLGGIGGSGSAPGQLSFPAGLAVDALGRLYVADTCNQRVQVIDPTLGTVLAVMQQIAGTNMVEPTDVAVDGSGNVYIADRRGAKVHVYNSSFVYQSSIAPAPHAGWPNGFLAQPVAVTIGSDGNLLIADEQWPQLIHMTPAGASLADVPLTDDLTHFTGLVLPTAPAAQNPPYNICVRRPVAPSSIWLPTVPAVDENGDQYVADPQNDVVLRKAACETDFTPIPCFGGHGWETGRLSTPIGVALDGRGYL